MRNSCYVVPIMDEQTVLHALVVSAGIGQIALFIGSLAIPKVLGWAAGLQKLRPLTRQVFWSYAAYIWTTNLCFGLISAFGADLLVTKGALSACVNVFITCYWTARVGIQFLYFDRTDLPEGSLVKLGEFALVILFIALSVIYGWATVFSLRT